MLSVYVEVFIGAFVLGMFLGVLLGFSVAQGWQLRAGRKCDMDRLIAHFHALFRQIDQEKQQRP